MLYSAGAAATTTVTVTENDNYKATPFGRTFLAVPAGNTNTVIYPRANAVSTVDASIVASWPYVWEDGFSLKVAVAAANPGDVVTCVITMSPGNRGL